MYACCRQLSNRSAHHSGKRRHEGRRAAGEIVQEARGSAETEEERKEGREAQSCSARGEVFICLMLCRDAHDGEPLKCRRRRCRLEGCIPVSRLKKYYERTKSDILLYELNEARHMRTCAIKSLQNAEALRFFTRHIYSMR